MDQVEPINPPQRAVVCKHWRWMPGMLARDSKPGAEYRTCRVLHVEGIMRPAIKGFTLDYAMRPGGPPPLPDRSWAPDLADAATVGALLALVREVWNDPTAYVRRGGGSEEIGVWHVHIDAGTHSVSRRGSTEGAALVAALEGAP